MCYSTDCLINCCDFTPYSQYIVVKSIEPLDEFGVYELKYTTMFKRYLDPECGYLIVFSTPYQGHCEVFDLLFRVPYPLTQPHTQTGDKIYSLIIKLSSEVFKEMNDKPYIKINFGFEHNFIRKFMTFYPKTLKAIANTEYKNYRIENLRNGKIKAIFDMYFKAERVKLLSADVNGRVNDVYVEYLQFYDKDKDKFVFEVVFPEEIVKKNVFGKLLFKFEYFKDGELIDTLNHEINNEDVLKS